jgi:hypothetical protein
MFYMLVSDSMITLGVFCIPLFEKSSDVSEKTHGQLPPESISTFVFHRPRHVDIG